jgi:hypothetical protein
MRVIVRLVLLATLLAGATGCALLSGGIASSDPFMSASERRVIVRIDNLNGQDVAVTALGPGRRHNVGWIQSRTGRQYSVPWSGQRQEIRFQLEPRSGRRVTVPGFSVGPGEFVALVITEPLQNSYVRR